MRLFPPSLKEKEKQKRRSRLAKDKYSDFFRDISAQNCFCKDEDEMAAKERGEGGDVRTIYKDFFRQKTTNLKCPMLLCGCADIHYGCSGLRAPYFILHMIAFPFHIFHTSHISFIMIHISHFIFLMIIHQHSLVTIHQTTISFHNTQEKYVWGTLCNISYSIRIFSITFRI